MLKSWLGKPLPWILIGLVFWVGHDAIGWRNALLRLPGFSNGLEFHEVILQGCEAVFHDVVAPIASIVVSASVLLAFFTEDMLPTPSDCMPRIFRCIRIWRHLRQSHSTRAECCKIFWTAIERGAVKQPGLSLPVLWARLEWARFYVLAFGTCWLSGRLMNQTWDALHAVATGTLKAEARNIAFAHLVSYGFPPSVVLSLILFPCAVISTLALIRRTHTRAGWLLSIGPLFLLSLWPLAYLPMLSGFELASQDYPRIKFC